MAKDSKPINTQQTCATSVHHKAAVPQHYRL